MKDSISGLSLNTLVRQMMCGIVFFIPITLWQVELPNHGWKWFATEFSKFHTCHLASFAVIAACVGTLIYHAEKNLWAYFWQYLRLKCPVLTIIAIFVLLIMGGAGMFKPFYPTWPCVPLYFFIIAVGGLTFLVPILIISPCWDAVIESTQNMWRVASRGTKDIMAQLEKKQADRIPESLELLECKEVARRESAWADYIHCGQTSAFAWLLGGAIVWYHAQSDLPKWLEPSLYAAVWLLGIELICEVHKQLHISRIVNDYFALPLRNGFVRPSNIRECCKHGYRWGLLQGRIQGCIKGLRFMKCLCCKRGQKGDLSQNKNIQSSPNKEIDNSSSSSAVEKLRWLDFSDSWELV